MGLPHSDIKHRASRLAGDGLEGDLVQRLPKRNGDVFPCLLDSGAGFPFGGDGILEQRGVDGFDDLAQRDGVGFFMEQVAAGFTAAAFDQARPAEVIEDLHQKICRDGFALRKFL